MSIERYKCFVTLNDSVESHIAMRNTEPRSSQHNLYQILRDYITSRLKDPITWFTIPIIAIFVLWAFFQVPPFLMLTVLFTAASVAEWYALVVWWRRGQLLKQEAIEVLQPAQNSWMILFGFVLALAGFTINLWIDEHTQSLSGFCFTVFGVSSLITIWYYWSRPIIVLPTGLVVGIEVMPWDQIGGMFRHERGDMEAVRIDFAPPRYQWFYGAKLWVTITAAQAVTLAELFPGSMVAEDTDHAD